MVEKTYKTVVVGSGAAGLNAADCLYDFGERDFVLITESLFYGTSRNTGSDKQTYYKLSLSGSDQDSVRKMALDYFNGGAVDGEHALVEAALSAQGFLKLASLGVPFPKNRYGEYVGYKTDHDPCRRATSAGPYTSKYMSEALLDSVRRKHVEILEDLMLVRILTCGDELSALLFIERSTGEPVLVHASYLILATGGPAGIYRMSVYPESQFGASGVAFEAGCRGKNLTEWQYGLGSVRPRWNVSGSYMQVLPRFVSVDKEGEHDFLSEFPLDRLEMLRRIFLKGYQWPFDVRKIENGSSLIDVLCYLELEKGRKVYLDFMHNPDLGPIPWCDLDQEVGDYLRTSGSMQDTPVERLEHLNMPAYSFYKEKGIDLEKEMLEISLCAQHNNGGISIDLWWRTDVKGMFVVGEAAGSHGIYRPGGSALNASQAGSYRAAEFISRSKTVPASKPFDKSRLDEILSIISAAVGNDGIDAEKEYLRMKDVMSLAASCIRDVPGMEKALDEVVKCLAAFSSYRVGHRNRIWMLFEFRNALVTQKVYLSAMIDYAKRVGKSRGGALYSRKDGAVHPAHLDDRFRYNLEDDPLESMVQEAWLDPGENVRISYRRPHPIPCDDNFFENVWTRYRKDGCVY